MSQYKDLPDELPALLVVGTKVTARLASAREHERGFYTGTVDAVDIDKHRYWVTFDRPGLGNHPIPDTEIRVSVCVGGGGGTFPGLAYHS